MVFHYALAENRVRRVPRLLHYNLSLETGTIYLTRETGEEYPSGPFPAPATKKAIAMAPFGRHILFSSSGSQPHEHAAEGDSE